MASIRETPGRASTFAAQLRQARGHSGLTQAALAERAGLSLRTIQHLEAGRSWPYASTVQRLADALALTAAERARLEATARPGAGAPEPEQPDSPELPSMLTQLVGREHELQQGCDLLSRTRLLTLTGAGGIGKTRLALELATRLAPLYSDGVCVVRLASLADPGLVAQRVAVATGARERPGRQQLEHLVRALRDQQILLVVDNCEHLLDACASLAEALLSGCRRLRILATSRERLGLTGETTWTVAPLAFPAPDSPPRPDELVRYPAVRLFLDRVADVQPGFTLEADADALGVALICSRLEGIPLALELAAARARVLALPEIAARLDDRLRLLSDTRRAGPRRYRTLRASIDWSYALLDPQEQTLFRQQSVFAGGWTLQAAEAVASDAAGDVFETLGRLIEKSLVRAVSAAGVTRYTCLETIREYAAERLAESPAEEAATRQRHADYFLDWCEQIAPGIRGSDQLRCLLALDAELDNLRAAAHWFAHGGRGAQQQLRVAAQLWEFWHVRGLFREGAGWLEAALATDVGVCRARADALDGLGVMTGVSGDLERASVFFQESARLFGELGDAAGSHAMCNNAITLAVGGATVSGLGWAEQGLAIAQESGDRWAEAYATYVLSWIASMEGQSELALRASAESIALFGQVGDLRGQSFARHVQGRALLHLGRPEDAVRPLHQALDQLARLVDTWGIACILSHLVLAEANRGNARHAAHLFGVGEGLRERMGAEPLPPDLVNRERGAALARAALGEAAFETAVAAGRAMHLSTAIAGVLAA